jgi:uncharacterized membrane protein
MSEKRALSGLAVGLVISLIANALLIGVLVGGWLGEPDRGHRGPRGGDHMVARGIEAIVPETNRGEIREAFGQAFRESRSAWRDKREARQTMVEAIAQTPFDKTELENAFERLRVADAAMTRAFQTTLVSQVSELSDSERADLVVWLEEMQGRRAERRRERRSERRDGSRRAPPSDDTD